MTILFRFPSFRCYSTVSSKHHEYDFELYLGDDFAHLALPVLVWRTLRNKNEICPRANTSHQCEPAAMSTHDLDHESPLVGECCRIDVVHGLTNPAQRRVAANCSIGVGKVVVY